MLKVQSGVEGFKKLAGLRIKVRYPNLAVESPDGSALAVFSHGHYVESLYLGVSKVKTAFFPKTSEPEDLKSLEGENFAWLDFFWSALSRSGEAGRKSEDILEGLQSRRKSKLLIRNLATGVAGWLCRIPFLRFLLTMVIFYPIFIGKGLFSTERGKPGGPLSKDAAEGLRRYLNVFLKDQLEKEYEARLGQGDDLCLRPHPQALCPSRAAITGWT